jgi:alkanesulfonate monooxygenase SsuD/methylene tetrahydromethanopterin reductase-like flavin-dependent oxidoreductase (luciferase family)
VEFGAHLPLIDFSGTGFDRASLVSVAATARRLGFSTLAANDHLVFRRPWLDGPTALAACLPEAGTLTLMTTISLPVVRHPAPLAKALVALDHLANGRVVAGVGPGSSAADYELVGVPFDERWPRFDEAVTALQVLLGRARGPFAGTYYRVDAPTEPVTTGAGVPIWVGSWGSGVALDRIARRADGWLASAYNTTPAGFAASWQRLGEALHARGRDLDEFPNALASTFLHVTDDPREEEHVLVEQLGPALGRDPGLLRDRLPVGPPARVTELLGAYADAGVQRLLLWPVQDPVPQLERFGAEVAPLLASD